MTKHTDNQIFNVRYIMKNNLRRNDMKQFKHLSIAGVFCLLLFAACDSKESPTPTPKPEEKHSISFSPTTFTVNAEAGTKTLTVTSSGNWTISGGTEWCSVSPSSGSAGTTSITLTFTENTVNQDKSTSLIGKCGNASATVVVTQKEKSSLTVTANKFEVNQDGGNIEVEVKTNVDIDIFVPPTCKWIKYISTKAISTKKVTFSIDANTEYDKRDGSIIIKDKSSTLSDTVYVYQAQKDAIVLTQEKYDVSYTGGNIKIEVKSNVEYEVKMPESDWLTLISTKALSSHTVEVAVKANETYYDREEVITFIKKDGSLSEEVVIHQLPTGALIISQKEYAIGTEGGTITVPLLKNVSLELNIKNDWIHVVNTKGLASDSLLFQIDANSTYYERTGEIVVSAPGYDIKETLYIVQDKKILVSVEEQEYTISDKGDVFTVTVKSNDEVKILIPDEHAPWLRNYSTKTVVTQNYYFQADPNPEFETRTGVIYFYHEQLEDGDTLYVKQQANTGIKLSSETVNIDASAGSTNYSFMVGADWSITVDREWCTVNTASGAAGSIDITINYQENKQFAPRKANVTIKTAEVSASVVLNQEARPGAPKNGISSYEELKAFRDANNARKDISQWQDDNGVVNLIADIVMPYNKESWVPISSFNKVFDGNGFSIDSMHVKQEIYAGLFSSISQGGVVRNVIMKKGCYIESKTTSNDKYYILKHCGSICGYNDGGTISNCENEAYMLYGRMVGGICGWNAGIVEGCRNRGAILSYLSEKDYCHGGICGYNGVTIRNCINESTAYGRGSAAEIGGIAGRNEGGIYTSTNYANMECTYSGSAYNTSIGGIAAALVSDDALINNCVNYGQITGYKYPGGIAGYNGGGDSGYGTISNSTNNGKVIGNGKQGGGITGINYCGDVISCVNKGQITEAMYAGGIVGYGDGSTAKIGKIDLCTNEGSVLASSAGGGICGYNRNYSRITNSSNSGSIESMGDYAGGVCGYNETNGIVYNCTNTGSVKSNKYTGDIIGNDSSATAPKATSSAASSLAMTSLKYLLEDLR